MKAGVFSMVLFALMVLAQWYVPLHMILGQEKILEEGKIYRFKVAPIDPNDPFRGKYVWLNYEADQVKVKVDQVNEWPGEWDFRKKPAYAQIAIDSAGFATFSNIFLEIPEGSEYMKVNVSWYDSESKTAHIEIPFDRYYMEESKALDAENYYNDALSSQHQNFSPKPAWAEIVVFRGDAVLTGLFIEGKSIEDCVKDLQQTK
jgi:uncharacterized membrane-anchored protein